MIRNRKFGILVSLSGILAAAPWLPATPPASLMSILAPVEIKTSAKVASTPDGDNKRILEAAVPAGPEFENIELEMVLNRLEDMISKDLGEDSTLSLSSSATWNPVVVEMGEQWSLALNNPFSPDTRGRWYASLDVIVGEEVIDTRNLRIEASLYKDVLLTGRRLERGDVPFQEGLQPVMRDVFLERGNPIPKSADLSEYELVRSVPEGYLLKWDDLKRCPSVRRGETVDVIVRNGSMTVTMRARSLEDGLVGDSVAVRNLSSHRELIGKVTGANQVQLVSSTRE